ncbi:lactate dehydrogenase [Clostridium bowmanii]|uniref:lactate/malate family dehydrogenase n=1 Tax=Clostridium bowmanii TaxID=132925 RepID=UPI001C0C90AB|nr:lactate dehydrogenase [Clostridium bowmanii]MBU3189791.1 lactate dehydrogenase [Clostridium bowmanii]MCA1074274.1 lactate dehydrogenase [Clostridium bowmanii]
MFYYICNEKLLISNEKYPSLEVISESKAEKYAGMIFALNKLNPGRARRSFSVSHENFLFLKEETLNLLVLPSCSIIDIPKWIKHAIDSNRVTSLNTEYPNWQEVLTYKQPNKWRINVIGLGDVGGTLLTGLKLLGVEKIQSLGLYDKDTNRNERYKYELSQILSPDMNESSINIVSLKENDVFDCDMFVFCVSVGVPEVGSKSTDVRLVQFKGNAKIIEHYAYLARQKNFKGIFAVVSDPVDLLCKAAFIESNKDNNGNMDFKGLAPEQVRGYGLGVMNARACYYALQEDATKHYIHEGRAFGPHGEGLIIADSIENYNEMLSDALTHSTKTANLEVRSTGFKPYIAPALSSGSLSILATINSQWHYSATFIGGTFMGSRNRLLPSGLDLETTLLNEALLLKLNSTYRLLSEFI